MFYKLKVNLTYYADNNVITANISIANDAASSVARTTTSYVSLSTIIDT